MSKGTAITAIVIALAAGFVLGNLVGRGQGSDEENTVANADDNAGGDGEGAAGGAAAAPDDGIERFRIPVTAAQPVRGAPDALVTIVMFSDFQCPFCGRVEPTLTQLMNEYRGKIRIVWRNQPLPFHPNAGPSAELAAEAMAQGGSAKFWAVHDQLFQNQANLDRPHLEQIAQAAGLDMAKVRDALDHNTHQAEITADSTLGTQIGANGTPAFFINGRNLMGAQPIDAFKQIIDDEVSRAERLVGTGVARNRVYAELTRNGKTSATPPAAAGAAPGQPGQPQPPRRMPDPNAVYRVPVGDSPARGPADALVTIVMFSDFQCPFCGRVEPTLVQIREQYGNDVRIVWKNNPLPFHPNAGPSAELAMEAFAQGGAAKFWEMHDLLFQNQQAIERANLETYATQLHLSAAGVRNALDNNTHQASIQADTDLARTLGASGTPSFFINGRNLRGAQPFEAFKTVIDEELAKARAKVAAGTPRARVYEATIASGATEAQTIDAPGAPAAPAAQPAAPDADHVYNIPLNPRAPSKGAAHGRVLIQQFSDFQCPFCSRVEPTVNQILEQYPTQVKIVWRQFPLPFHENAMPAAEASQEVLAQGGPAKFWAFHALLFANQQTLDRAHLEQFAGQVGGIDMNRFRQALDNHTHHAEVQADIDAVNNAGAQIGTPSFFINGRLVQGAQPFDAFKTAIDRAIAEAH